jgi:hypothetical protein
MKMSIQISLMVNDLEALAKLGGAETESAVNRLKPALEPVFRTRVLELLTSAAEETNGKIPGAHLEARLNGDEAGLVVVPDETSARETPSELNARITLRLSEDLKSRIESAAVNEGISLNSWLLKASERGSFAISRSGRQLKGKGRS